MKKATRFSLALLCCGSSMQTTLSIDAPGSCTEIKVIFSDGNSMYGRCEPKLGIPVQCYFTPPEPYDKKTSRTDWAAAEAKKLGVTVTKIEKPVYHSTMSQKEYDEIISKDFGYNKLIKSVRNYIISEKKIPHYADRNYKRDKRKISYLDFSKTDLSKADLSSTEFIDCNFSGANLSSTIMKQSHLQGTNLSEANLDKINLSYAKLTYVNLDNAKLSNANLSNANLMNVSLRNTDLSNADLTNTKMTNATFLNTNFKGVKGLSPRDLKALQSRGAIIDAIAPTPKPFEQKPTAPTKTESSTLPSTKPPIEQKPTTLSKEDLKRYVLKNKKCPTANCDLSNTQFAIGTDLSNVNFTGANLTGATLIGVILNSADFSGAELQNASLGFSFLSSTNFSKANLSGASFVYNEIAIPTELINSNFTGADLSSTNLSNVDCKNTNFSEAVFEKTNLSKAVFSKCNFTGTQYSEGGKKFPVTTNWLKQQGATVN